MLVSRTGRLSDLFVPSSAIANVDDGVVYLNLAKGDAKDMRWEQAPRETDPLETTPESDLHRHV